MYEYQPVLYGGHNTILFYFALVSEKGKYKFAFYCCLCNAVWVDDVIAIFYAFIHWLICSYLCLYVFIFDHYCGNLSVKHFGQRSLLLNVLYK